MRVVSLVSEVGAKRITEEITNSLQVLERKMAGTTRLELATSAVTGQRSNQLNYVPAFAVAAIEDGKLQN